MKYLNLLLLLSAILCFASCGKDDDDSTDDSCATNATLMVDGVAWEVESGTHTLLTPNGGKRLDLRFKNSANQDIIFTITNIVNPESDDCLNVKTYYGNPLLNESNSSGYEGGIVSYIPSSQATYMNSLDEDDQTQIVITSCNNRKISGTIDAYVIDFFNDNETTYHITGSFENVCY